MKKRASANWEEVYKSAPLKKLPWYMEGLDRDFKKAIKKYGIIPSSQVLDLGTGFGMQAHELHKRGFEVTATDISANAIKGAKKLASIKKMTSIKFIQDDITKSGIEDKFDAVFDRGCFHVLHSKDRETYIDRMAKVLKRNGYLFLKTFSVKIPSPGGPYRYTPKMINDYFYEKFEIVDTYETTFQSTMEKDPIAIFTVLKKK